MSLLVGLESEIIGEKEIFIQIKDSIENSFLNKDIDEISYKGLLNLLDIANNIRLNNSIFQEENYSTIGANLVIDINNKKNSSILVIGSGYMSECFINIIEPEFKKIILANRNKIKAKKLVNRIDTKKITIVDIESVPEIIDSFDFIFCAISNSQNKFENYRIKSDAIVLDISYPQVFSENINCSKFYSIANTSFSSLVKYPVLNENILNAQKDIISVIEQIYKE